MEMETIVNDQVKSMSLDQMRRLRDRMFDVKSKSDESGEAQVSELAGMFIVVMTRAINEAEKINLESYLKDAKITKLESEVETLKKLSGNG